MAKRDEIRLRIVVNGPVPGILTRMQKGRSELIEPLESSSKKIVFEVAVDVDTSAEQPNFLGPFTQGPKDQRFLYVNYGRAAGQFNTDCSRRAKLSLMSISKDDVLKVVNDPTLGFEAEYDGTAKDGLPSCATIKGLAWRIVPFGR